MRRRSYLIGVAALAAALVPTALAATERTYEQRFVPAAKGRATTKPDTGTGTHLIWTATDPANDKGNEQPQQDEYLDVIFPKGSVVDQRVPGSCRATDAAIAKNGAAACPKRSKVGSGSMLLRPPSGPDLGAKFDVFNCERGCVRKRGIPPTDGELILPPAMTTSASNIKSPPTIRAWVENRGGAPGIHIPLDILCVNGESPPCGDEGDARVVRFELQLDKVAAAKPKVAAARRGRGVATGGRGGAYGIVTPHKCSQEKGWVFTLIAHGRDGSDEKLTSRAGCRPE